ncbi:hypothetical protein HYALB_00007843 [Hymenoscyphus albidus]|uniref:Fumarylacetoacetase-like C-terminal domain-containing protein n=1 Tax=Hymenoscyphus albidus TaxID=595503 RepID=A0A9N9LK50_9HELO|nr:hypothetical protein HYALB_00007843 [Hymenoscyphus albidus]
MSIPTWGRLVRFIATDNAQYCGEPVDPEIDVGLAILAKQEVLVKVLDTKSALDIPASFTGEVKTIKELLSPVSAQEVGTIRCIGLNYKDHAAELNFSLPENPDLFMKPASTLNSPTAPILIPSAAAEGADGEVELALVISKDCKNVTSAEALDYVLGHMTANDVTSRGLQPRTSQWGYCKGFDGFCPVVPTLVSTKNIPDPSVLLLKTVLGGKTLQDGKTENMIFSVAEIIAYLSVGTTIPKGTVILTGTPAGIGHSHKPPAYLTEGADLRVWISHGLGTLVNSIALE